ncbi:EF-hand domain-containing protein [Planctomycetota bacterium]
MAEIPGLGPSHRYETQQLKRAADKLMSRKDADGNGTLNAEELGGPEGSFEKVDANADGQVDKAELIANKPRPLYNCVAAQTLRKMDTDGDGTLTADELGVSDESFDKIDKNQGGQTDKKELGGLLQRRDGKAELLNSTEMEQVIPPQTAINIYNQTNIFLKDTDSEGESGQTDQQV